MFGLAACACTDSHTCIHTHIICSACCLYLYSQRCAQLFQMVSRPTVLRQLEMGATQKQIHVCMCVCMYVCLYASDCIAVSLGLGTAAAVGTVGTNLHDPAQLCSFLEFMYLIFDFIFIVLCLLCIIYFALQRQQQQQLLRECGSSSSDSDCGSGSGRAIYIQSDMRRSH